MIWGKNSFFLLAILFGFLACFNVSKGMKKISKMLRKNLKIRYHNPIYNSAILPSTIEKSVKPKLNIFDAIKNKDINSIKTLIKEEKEIVNITDNQGNTPLYLACENIKKKRTKIKIETEIVRLLLDNGADKSIGKIGKYGDTPLYQACYNNVLGIVELLMKHGAKKSVNKTDANNWTPFHWACESNSIKWVDENNISEYNYKKNFKIVKLLLPYCTLTTINKAITNGFYKNETPLYWACKNGNLKMAKLLLKNGAHKSVNKTDLDGWTPLHWACQNNHLKIVKLLLHYNSDPNKCDKYDKTPLFIACEKEHLNIIKSLLLYCTTETINKTKNTAMLTPLWFIKIKKKNKYIKNKIYDKNIEYIELKTTDQLKIENIPELHRLYNFIKKEEHEKKLYGLKGVNQILAIKNAYLLLYFFLYTKKEDKNNCLDLINNINKSQNFIKNTLNNENNLIQEFISPIKEAIRNKITIYPLDIEKPFTRFEETIKKFKKCQNYYHVFIVNLEENHWHTVAIWKKNKKTKCFIADTLYGRINNRTKFDKNKSFCDMILKNIEYIQLKTVSPLKAGTIPKLHKKRKFFNFIKKEKKENKSDPNGLYPILAFRNAYLLLHYFLYEKKEDKDNCLDLISNIKEAQSFIKNALNIGDKVSWLNSKEIENDYIKTYKLKKNIPDVWWHEITPTDFKRLELSDKITIYNIDSEKDPYTSIQITEKFKESRNYYHIFIINLDKYHWHTVAIWKKNNDIKYFIVDALHDHINNTNKFDRNKSFCNMILNGVEEGKTKKTKKEKKDKYDSCFLSIFDSIVDAVGNVCKKLCNVEFI